MSDQKQPYVSCEFTDDTSTTILPTSQQINQIMLHVTTFESFSARLDNNYHNYLHITIGGDMETNSRKYLFQESENLLRHIDCNMTFPYHGFTGLTAHNSMQVEVNTNAQEKAHIQTENCLMSDPLPRLIISGSMSDSSISPNYPPIVIWKDKSMTETVQDTTTKHCSICSAKAKFPHIFPELCESCWDKEHTCQKCKVNKYFKECLVCDA